jgi:hypothetical protein
MVDDVELFKKFRKYGVISFSTNDEEIALITFSKLNDKDGNAVRQLLLDDYLFGVVICETNDGIVIFQKNKSAFKGKLAMFYTKSAEAMISFIASNPKFFPVKREEIIADLIVYEAFKKFDKNA